MKCPVCGEPIHHGKSKCLKCGYEYKSLVLSQINNEDDENQDDTLYKEINPDDIHMGHQTKSNGGGSILDELFGGSIFGSRSFSGGGLFGGFSSIIDDIFGGLFGVEQDDEDDDYDGENHYVDAFGNPIPIDVFNQDFVEVDEIEEYDADGNLKTPKKQDKKGFFNRKKKDGK